MNEGPVIARPTPLRIQRKNRTRTGILLLKWQTLNLSYLATDLLVRLSYAASMRC